MKLFELTTTECIETLARLKFGRLGCSRANQPYIVPFNFACHDQHLYSAAMPGQKVEWMRTNPLVCVEADEVIDHLHWTSVVVQGRYEECRNAPDGRSESDLAFTLRQQRASWWEPAFIKAAYRGAGEQVSPMYYRIRIEAVTGRRAEPDPVETEARPEPAASSEVMGWIKRLRRRVGPS
jgi:nitroimidazol reductase NimA-like FMN-containing flavoprotein (pyridoxamine 5'-phosphate oxidase superfamily)